MSLTTRSTLLKQLTPSAKSEKQTRRFDNESFPKNIPIIEILAGLLDLTALSTKMPNFVFVFHLIKKNLIKLLKKNTTLLKLIKNSNIAIKNFFIYKTNRLKIFAKVDFKMFFQKTLGDFNCFC